MPQEYVPFDAYGLLRRIVGRGPQRVRRDLPWEDKSARYLLKRKLAQESSVDNARIENTDAGATVGLIDVEPSTNLRGA